MKKYKPTKEEILEFLCHNNYIEGVYDTDSIKQAQEAWKYLTKQKKLTIGVVLKTHKILMLNQGIQPDEKGYFRRCEVTIGNQYGLNWVKVPEAMEVWREGMNATDSLKGQRKNEAFIKKLHVFYEHIHPFVDGNGRTGRMFMNWQKLKAGLPLFIIHEGKEQFDYYKWFK